MSKKEIPLKSGRFYHIFNCGNNKENLFYFNDNYEYFLRKYDEYLSDYLETFAFCLLPNHFHLLVFVKEFKNFKEQCVREKIPSFEKMESLEELISYQFRRFFISYSMAINKKLKRTGSLFRKNFKRIEISNTKYLMNLVFYIHANPQLHEIIDDFRMYPWSSYERVLRNRPSKLEKEKVLEWFKNKENYISYHAQKADIAELRKIMIEQE